MKALIEIPRLHTTLSTLAAALLAVSLTGCLSSGGGGSDPTATPPAATTTEGEVQGVVINGMRVFRGIPYAAAPVGELRFASTRPPAQRNTTLELSDEFGAMCPQTNISTRQIQGEEDCLFLNVYAPAEGEDLPVMVWIHGGAFVFGNGGGEYDPQRLVEKDVIVVTLNYRLGNLGFLAHPSLDDDAGNFALMDQQEALRWVKKNIAEFGGDPANVTLFGESAGGHSVMSHIVSPRAQTESLFQRAIVQSGSYAPFQQPKVVAQGQGRAIAAGLGCTDPATLVSCLRSASVPALLALQGSQGIPAVDPDTNLLPLSIMDALASGKFNTSLDVMIGSNQNEGTLFVALDELTSGSSLETQGEAEYRRRVTAFFAPYQALVPYDSEQIADDYLELYKDTATPFSLALSAIWTEFMFACNSSLHAGTFAGASMNTFQYWFRDEDAPYTLVPPTAVSFELGATHAGEIPYVLYPETVMQDRYTGDQADVDTLASEMVDYWTTFAKNGDPNTADGVAAAWPQVAAGQLMQLDLPNSQAVTSPAFLGFHRCGYWAAPPLNLAARP
ncbi:carboxylesterase family protein [uncultured Halopseudomonas sp.]|uniref:carboxylesterase/lipase family protein n=1 Tax=uncultured Halopseudomonas sp. TaxID=2901193 RepID=UPI0030ECE379|tara:strand:- start:25549 stop:27225 length:1677 start_codon:yes stop_codon:yes gene_type:complete